MKINEIKSNPNNPRLIKEEKFRKLVKSIKDFPEMMELRPIVIDENNMIQGGNMRYQALLDLKFKEIPDSWIKKGKDLTEEQWKEFVIKDNSSFGEWEWDTLANEWDSYNLSDWGVNLPFSTTPNFEPTLDPLSNYSDVTKEQIQKEAIKLANQMMDHKKQIECICPECGAEFNIDQ